MLSSFQLYLESFSAFEEWGEVPNGEDTRWEKQPHFIVGDLLLNYKYCDRKYKAHDPEESALALKLLTSLTF